MRWGTVLVLCVMSSVATAQESRLHAELRREGQRIREACDSFGVKLLTGCAYTLFTDHPLHIAAGSMPPQNGFGLGPALVWNKNAKNWRMSWDFDAVGGTGGAWRAGGYMTLAHTPAVVIKPIAPVAGGPSPIRAGKPPGSAIAVHPYTVFNFYAQTISLNKLNFFGLGNDTTLAGASAFGMRETIVGGKVTKPVFEWPAIRKLDLSLMGEINGRFVAIRPEYGQSVPSIEQVYTDATAPGLNGRPGFIQFGEGVRVEPKIGVLHLNYSGRFEQFASPFNSQYSFLRWAVDLDHVYLLHGKTVSTVSGRNGPDDCAPSGQACPSIPTSINVNGSVGVRLFVSESVTSGTNRVPFYFQQTMGGQDVNSSMMLGSYQDYRFRAPNLLFLEERFEHSIWGPLGLQFVGDQGRVALKRGDLGFDDLKHSFAVGFTLRAGAFPMVSLMFAWGGPEGHHTMLNMNTSLLGGGARPSLD